MQDQAVGDENLHPNSWLKEMARLNPAKWNISRSCRAAFAVAFPMTIGYLTDTLMYTMWLSMGGMFPSIGERDAPYRFTVRKILVSAPIGASGFLLGYLGTSGIDWGWVVLIMALVAFCLAIASTYSAAISIGCLQFMVMAAVAIGNPEIGHFWLSSVLLLCGAAFYLFLIFLERLIHPHHLRRDAIVQVLQALSTICDKKKQGEDPEEARLAFNIQYEALYTFMLQSRYNSWGHNAVIDQTATVAHNLDLLFAALLAEQNAEEAERIQIYLQKIKEAFEHDRSFNEPITGTSALCRAANDLTISLWGNVTLPNEDTPAQSTSLPWRVLLQKLTPGRTTVRSAAALALCTTLGYSIRWFYDMSHWYWVPMTVAIVMKPELGSIFVRAVQRAAGTAVGVVIGGLLLAYIPVGPVFILFIAAITFSLPWLAQRNYAMTAFGVTPLVLVLIDFLSPERQGLDYAALRLTDTLTGCAIVLIFGYLLWPRRHFSELNQSMNDARHAIAGYLRSVLDNREQPDAAPLSDARRTAYGKLVDMRSALQRSMAEPPPAGYEAAAWFPLVACAARLCDAITVYSANASPTPNPEQWALLQKMPQAIDGLEPLLNELPDSIINQDTPESRLLVSLHKEANLRESLYDRVQPPRKHASHVVATSPRN
jgi:uncharacterized membrane protein YccC